MSAKSIREYHGKKLLARWLQTHSSSVKYDVEDRAMLVTPASLRPEDITSFAGLPADNPWLLSTQLVVKPDQLIKRRGKAGLLAINKSWPEVVDWIKSRMNKECQVEQVSGILDHFIVEPFVAHDQSDEYYICIQSHRSNDEILFTHDGGVDVGDVDAKALRLPVALTTDPSADDVSRVLLQNIPADRRALLSGFIVALYKLFRDLNFVYMEINPLVMTSDGRITPLDMAAKIDETAHFLNSVQWGSIDFPAPFGRAEFPEEAFIKRLDQGSGSSLKLTILNQYGRIWTMVAGGGASVVYADTISDLGFGEELANYGEYSGAPTLQETYEYARTIFKLMTRHKDPRGKVLIIGGGIANFTDVASTFTGIQKALSEFREELLDNQVQIWVRRAGPNYQEGLKNMRLTADKLGLPIHLYGPETHMTAVVPLALGLRDAAFYPQFDAAIENRAMMAATSTQTTSEDAAGKQSEDEMIRPSLTREPSETSEITSEHAIRDFTPKTRCIVYGLQTVAVQGMLDFDFMCQRKQPSVACMVFPFSGNHYMKLYWGTDETLIPVYTTLEDAVTKHRDASVMVGGMLCCLELSIHLFFHCLCICLCSMLS